MKLWILLFAVWASLARAESITWGGELTFTSARHREVMKRAPGTHGPLGTRPWSQENQEALEAFYRHMKGIAKDRSGLLSVRLLEEEDKWGNDVVRVTYRDGWHFDVTMDPWCLEVVLPPFTLAELRKNKGRIQRDIFDQMAKIDLFPDRQIGGGHLHMGMTSGFGDDVRLFRNWLVDFANHTELADGALEKDYDNARPLYRLNAAQRRLFKEFIDRADGGEFTTVRKMATKFVAEVLFESKPATGKRIMQYKYWQVNLLRMAKLDTWDTLDANRTWDEYEAWVLFDEVEKHARTAEVRHLSAQMSAQHLVNDVELQEGRIKYLKGLKKNLVLSQDFLAGRRPTPKQAALQFFAYLLQSGVDPADFAEHLPKAGDGVREWKAWQTEFAKLQKKCPAHLQAYQAL